MNLQPVNNHRPDRNYIPPGFKNAINDDETSEEYFLNMGPQHPSTHGVLRLVVKLNGENVLEVVPHLGYVHRSVEKVAENQTYLQNIHLTDRLDYLSSHINNLGYCLAIEQALDIGVPERGEYIRVMVSELQRIQSHLLWWGVSGMDLGAVTTFLYGFKEREIITDIFEELCGARLTMNFFRPGGSFADVPNTFIPRVRDVIKRMHLALDEYKILLTDNIIFRERTRAIGILSREKALSYGCSGAVLRASGVSYDVRRNDPYSIYDRFDFEVPTGTVGGCFDRYQLKMEEMAQSVRILEQAVETFPNGPYRSREMPAYKLPRGIYYSQVETARGLLGTYIVAEGGPKPYRVKFRSPCFSNLSALNEMAAGHKIADLVTILATLDFVVPEIDR
ncbi:NADH-quinone oxidoreductase subunit 4 [bacterium BMS3Bbin14]|nr:NADH-quinone oxidoreductase subunit 4 [bacterium BMS3Abin13]GBE51938.1 NADH-quinone oxidoreductase subunit 4 [bacterium BMS3Bbin14]HDK42969.1 NADH-quinone oxidoreductase subunit D [Desulfobacteraceae bacterium]HDL98414.1 NADH-quinone oxidoreductase subunit D [Desulfobacteraceae bacterium]HDO29489.1 NADH-quinone oxidoreductase subunit D [Desulfobacteraceae bacterium]